MPNELKHKDVGTELTRAEWEGIDSHEADGQTANDMLYFNGTSWIRSTAATIRGILGVATIVRKTADQTVNNSIVLVNDTHLLFAVAANEVWAFDATLLYLSSATPDIKFGFSVPAAGDLHWGHEDLHWEGTSTLLSPGSTDSCTAVGDAGVHYRGIYIGGANAGNVQLQWAQNVANVSDTKVLTNSFIIAHRLA